MSDVLVLIGPANLPVRKADLSAVGFGKIAAELLGTALDIVCLGPAAQEVASAVGNLGARTVFAVEHEDLSSYTAEAYAAAMAAIIGRGTYRLIAASASTASRDYFPRVAASLDLPMASDVLKINQLTADQAVFTRAVFAGNLLADLALSGPSALVTCRASEFEPAAECGMTSPIESFKPDGALAMPGKRFVSLEATQSDRPDLTEADVVITGGRGTRGAEGFKLIDQLADQLSAAVGATRAAVDAGWMPNDTQVGQTGKIVAPKLYFAVGLSGAIQHLAGMRNAKTVVAINTDAEAPIFEVADIGLVGDLFEVLPRLTTAIQAKR